MLLTNAQVVEEDNYRTSGLCHSVLLDVVEDRGEVGVAGQVLGFEEEDGAQLGEGGGQDKDDQCQHPP